MVEPRMADLPTVGSPVDVAVNHTLAFLRRVLPSPNCRLLEVGCGTGDLAGRLAAAGARLTAIDSSEKAVCNARSRGVPALHADILTFESSPFDVVLFTRSLHHIASLPGALDRATALLKPNGLLVLEEFALEAIDHSTARRNYDLQAILQCAGLMPQTEDDGDQSPATDPLAHWVREHDHDPPLHHGQAMIDEIERRFAVRAIERVPYLYRYFCSRIEPSDRGCRTAEAILAIERRLIDEGLIRALGLRVVASRRSEY